MATIKNIGGGRARVQWYDSNGVRHRSVLPAHDARDLYDQVCADKVFDKTNSGHRLKAARKIEKLRFVDLALKYRNEHLLNTRAASNAYYVDILIKKWGAYKVSMLQVMEFRKWIKFALEHEIVVPDKSDWKLFKLSASSVNKLIRYMIRVFNWSIEEGLINVNPMQCVKDTQLKKEFRRRNTFKPVVLSTTEFWEMVKEWPAYVRNPAVCCFFSGIRASELSQITWTNTNRELHRFEFEAHQVKESDSKNVYYDPEIDQILEDCYIDYITNGYTDDQVFHGAEGGRLSKDSYGHLVRFWADKTAEKTGIEKYKKVSPHTFRRSYRTRKDLEGVDRRAVAANMGHHSLSTSEIYNIMDDERMSSVAGVRNPLNPQVNNAVEELIQCSKQAGLSLNQIQAAVRQAFMMGIFGHSR